MSSHQPNIKLALGTEVSGEAILEGDITIGSGTVVQPRARILAEAGPIIIGQGNTIQENATIANKISGHTQIIGNSNMFQTDSTCEAFGLGDGNILETRSFVGKDVELTNGCIVRTGCRLTGKSTIPQRTVIDRDQ